MLIQPLRTTFIVFLALASFTLAAGLVEGAFPDHEAVIYDALPPPPDTSRFNRGTLSLSFHLEDRYGLQVYVVSQRFQGPVVALETVEFEKDTFVPIRATRVQRVSGVNVETDVAFQGSKAVMTVHTPDLLGGGTRQVVVDLPKGAVPLQELPFLLRNRGFQAGDEWSIPVLHLFGGTPGAKSATIKVGEKVKLSSGREAWKLSISLDGETWACWFGTGPGAPLLRSQRVFSSDPALARYRLRYKSSDPALR